MDGLNKEPFFSICIPNYNYASYVNLTIESVLAQTFADFEIIVADNASTDNSVEVVKSYMARDKRISLHQNRYNVGFAPNLQKATERAKGKYIILLSSDDLMNPDALEAYHKTIAANGNTDNMVLHSGVDFVDSQGKMFERHLKPAKQGRNNFYYESFPLDGEANSAENQDGSFVEIDSTAVLKDSIIKGKTPGFFLTVCYSRKLWEDVEGYDLNYMFGPDTFFLYKLLSRNPKFIYVRKSLFQYRVHQANQNSIALRSGAIKQQLDKYIYTYSADGKMLERIGLSRRDLEKSFVKIFCIRESMVAQADGLWLRAFKLHAFSWASYPGIALKTPLTYANIIILMLGPIGTLILNLGKKLRRKGA